MTSADLVVERPAGLYCPPGDFYIDPWRPVDRAVITHAHADHARSGHGHYLASARSAGVLRSRLPYRGYQFLFKEHLIRAYGAGGWRLGVLRSRLGAITLQPLAYGEVVEHRGVRISLHPAGHVLGSSQVRLEHGGRVWVASGDYFATAAAGAPGDEDNLTCEPFEPVRCDCFITESTFGLPVYRWRPQREVYADINAWWSANAEAGRASLLLGYSFGKAQRLLAGVDPGIGPIVVHDAIAPLNAAYRAAGVQLPVTQPVAALADRALRQRALVLAPPAVRGSAWVRQLGDCSDAFASGWMQLRGGRRRQGLDRGFALSDHADWPGLQRAITATGASRVIVTHGEEAVMVRWLRQQGLQAESFSTEYGSGDDSGA